MCFKKVNKEYISKFTFDTHYLCKNADIYTNMFLDIINQPVFI
jgi:hypothetical protein